MVPGRCLKNSASPTFSSAYRHCPIWPPHYRYAGLVVQDPSSGRTFLAKHFAMPFGAVAAVYAWDRGGNAVTAVLRHFLGAPLLRYVDDLFWALQAGKVPGRAECTFIRALRQFVIDVVGALGFALDLANTPDPLAVLTVPGGVGQMPASLGCARLGPPCC